MQHNHRTEPYGLYLQYSMCAGSVPPRPKDPLDMCQVLSHRLSNVVGAPGICRSPVDLNITSACVRG